VITKPEQHDIDRAGAAWICEETGDREGVVLTILSALMTTHSTDSKAYRWAIETAGRLSDPNIKADAKKAIERAVRRWAGEALDGDYQGDTIWQIIQNIASGMAIELSAENDPLAIGLRIAARDNSSERVLATCEHILDSLGATGPTARRVERLFNISTADSKVIHCTVHNYHFEGKDLDSAYVGFKRRYCNTCPDRKPRPKEWRGTQEEIDEIRGQHRDFVASLTGTSDGFRYTNED
jgi:hypothetical protein